jgi:hypothetical protein
VLLGTGAHSRFVDDGMIHQTKILISAPGGRVSGTVFPRGLLVTNFVLNQLVLVDIKIDRLCIVLYTCQPYSYPYLSAFCVSAGHTGRDEMGVPGLWDVSQLWKLSSSEKCR